MHFRVKPLHLRAESTLGILFPTSAEKTHDCPLLFSASIHRNHIEAFAQNTLIESHCYGIAVAEVLFLLRWKSWGKLKPSWKSFSYGRVHPVEFFSLLRKIPLRKSGWKHTFLSKFWSEKFSKSLLSCFYSFPFLPVPFAPQQYLRNAVEFCACTGFHIIEIFYPDSFTNVV